MFLDELKKTNFKWDYDKNDINPLQTKCKSNKKLWFICDKGHSFETRVSDIFILKKCPYCANKKVLKGFNDLYTTHPRIAVEWDYDKNDILPTQITYGSGKKVWWICSRNHSWEESPNRRTSRNSECVYCSGKKVTPGLNDLATIHPEVLDYWDFDKNDIDIHQTSPATSKKVWWICDHGHSFFSSIHYKTNHIAYCPYCSNKKILQGFNDLTTTHPEMASEWDYDKNDILPTQITYGSTKKVYWKCKEGHSWYAKINSRTSHSLGCPYF